MDKFIMTLKGYAAGTLLFFVLSLIISLVIYFTDMTFSYAGEMITGVLSVSSGLQSVFAGNAFGKKGLLTGTLFGIFNTFLFVFIVTAILDKSFSESIMNMIYIIPVIVSAAGGVIGANLRK